MNIQKLKQLEHEFLARYPEGFASPEMKEVVKRHKPDKMDVINLLKRDLKNTNSIILNLSFKP